MFAFVVYALMIWFLAAKFRRRWPAYAVAVAGLFGVILVAFIHFKVGAWSGGRFFLGSMQMLLYPYAALVFSVALFIASVPRRHPEGACHRCGYDLGGLESLGLTCPECGERQPVMVEGRACGLCRHDLGRRARSRGTCPGCRFPHVPDHQRAGPRPRLAGEL